MIAITLLRTGVLAACADSAEVRYLLIGGPIVAENGTVSRLDIQKLKSDAARVVTRLAA
jgi:hypothetical protein